jgi:type III secretion protein U
MASEKTEQATTKKRQDARKKGQVAFSPDVSSTAILIAVFTVIGLSWKQIRDSLSSLLLIPIDYISVPFAVAFPQVLAAVATKFAFICLPIIGAAFITAIAAGAVQVGFNFSFDPIIPKFEKLNPINKLKHIFGAKGLIELLKNIVKTVFLSALIALLIRDLIDPISHIPFGGLEAIFESLGPVMTNLAVTVSLAYIVFAAFDLWLKQKQHSKDIMMAKEEVKQEYKEMEGSPEIKSKRKQLHRELLNQDTLARTKKAKALIINPTHYAVAIDYDAERTKLPIVLAKAEGALARQMIEVAKENGIPIMQNVPLAQALFQDGLVDQYIPKHLLEPVAEVLRWVRERQDLE